MTSKSKAYLFLVLACFFWGATPLCGRILKDSLSPMLITGARFTLVSIILFTFLYLKGGFISIKVSWHDFKLLIAMGTLGIFLHNTLLFEGLKYTTASNAALIESIGPAVTSVCAFLFIGERLSKSGWLGILVSLIGAMIIVSKGSLKVITQFEFNIGELLVVICEILWSVYVVISYRLSPDINALSVTAYTALVGALLCFCFGSLSDSLIIYKIEFIDVVSFLVLSLFAGIVAFASWNYAICRVGASKGGIFVYLIPLFGAILGFVVLGETLIKEEIIGALFVIAGMIVSVRAKLSNKSEQ